ncbi:MAG: hypothetical protein ABTQ25_01690 [Nitrosomonas ureae]
MNTKMLPQMIAMSLTAILFLGTGCATTKAEAPADAQAQNHEEHHPEGEAVKADTSQSDMMGKGGMMNNGMMGKMDMGQMMGMMQQCMAMHKDGNMCDHQTMEKCQENMGKQQCMNMMNQAKKQEKSTKKSK